METELKQQWFKIGGTNIYTTGHYVVEKEEVKAVFQNDIFDNGENLHKVENNEIVTTRLKTDKRVLFYFFPLKVHGKYLMEGNVSGVALEEIEEILPYQIKEILVNQRFVRYKSTY